MGYKICLIYMRLNIIKIQQKELAHYYCRKHHAINLNCMYYYDTHVFLVVIIIIS
jgi:hypothetical protein